MAPTKREEARGEALPSYEEVSDPSSNVAPVELPAAPAELPAELPADLPVAGPTISSPFNFPSDAQLPPYAEQTPSSTEQRPIAIPQIKADPTAPFLDAYSQLLLRHGVTKETWAAFLNTLSGFLAATVSQKAVSHAAEMAQHVSDVPKRFGQETWQHAKKTGRVIREDAKRGNFVGAAVHVVAGSVALPLAATFRAVGASIALPMAAVGAVVREPKTPRERAAAYAESANVRFLRRRGLEARLLDTDELARALGLSAAELLRTARAAKEYPSAEAQIRALAARVVELDLSGPGHLELEASTLWLVVTQRREDHGHHHVGEKGERR
ncbi:hypothetical protein F4818DRAFT_452242 [Hypoxylon cercidicola]|nr:hypothetical protein F4818DRAFT_452242 [Hypoxylon cercidicola]